MRKPCSTLPFVLLVAISLSVLLPATVAAQWGDVPEARSRVLATPDGVTVKAANPLPTYVPAAFPVPTATEGVAAEGAAASTADPLVTGVEARALGALPAAVDPGDAVRDRGSLSGIRYVTLTDPAGTYVYGAAATPLRIDPTGTTRQPVNPIAGQVGIAANAGAADALTTRTISATDDPAVTSLGIIDDWDEANRAAVNPIAGQIGIQGDSGAATALTTRTTEATDSQLSTDTATSKGYLQTISGWDVGAGAASATTLQCIAPTDDPGVTLLGTIDADTGNIATDASTIAGDTTSLEAALGTVGAAVPATGYFVVAQDVLGNVGPVLLDSLGNVQARDPLSAAADYDSGAGTADQSIVGLALPGAGGPTAVSSAAPLPVQHIDALGVIQFSAANPGEITGDVDVASMPGTAADAAAALPAVLPVVAGWDGAAVRAISTTAAGLVNVADGGGALTVDGTVTGYLSLAGTAVSGDQGLSDAGTLRVVEAQAATASDGAVAVDQGDNDSYAIPDAAKTTLCTNRSAKVLCVREGGANTDAGVNCHPICAGTAANDGLGCSYRTESRSLTLRFYNLTDNVAGTLFCASTLQ